MDNLKKKEDEQLLNHARKTWERILNQTRDAFCRNAVLGLKEVKTLFGKVVDYKLTASGCQNPKRNGSKFCQSCADKFKNK